MVFRRRGLVRGRRLQRELLMEPMPMAVANTSHRVGAGQPFRLSVPRAVLPLRPSRFQATPSRWLRAAAALSALVLMAATLSARARYAYCAAMGPIAGMHCACGAKALRAAEGLTVQAADCHRVVTIGALPLGTRLAPVTDVPFPPLVRIISSVTGHVPADERTATLARSFQARQRAGPSAKGARTRLMVFLL